METQLDEQQLSTPDLLRLLRRSSSPEMAAPGEIAAIDRRPSDYQSSYALEEVDLQRTDGTTLRLMLKNLDRTAMSPHSRSAKPAFLHDPRREIEVYRRLLAGARLGTPHYFAAPTVPAPGDCWLCIERVEGEVLAQVGDFHLWQAVARYLADMHAVLAERIQLEQTGAVPLLRYDRNYYQQWFDRAVAFREIANPADSQQLKTLWPCYKQLLSLLVQLPAGVIHGEFYPSNVLVVSSSAGLRICPIDWEMAAHGPLLFDLAALVSGGWTPQQRQELARAYYDRAGTTITTPGSFASLLVALDACRLQLAIQWLGWAEDWSPPPHQTHDWLADALQLAAELRL